MLDKERTTMLAEVTYKVKGTSAMLMHNAQLANPRNEWTREMKKLTGKRKKTEEDQLEISRLEFMGGLYLDDQKSHFVIPSCNWEAVIAEAARKVKLGKVVKEAIFIYEDSVIAFSGPKTPDERWNDPSCLDYRSVAVEKKRVMRTRPKFDEWSCEVKIMFDPELIDHEAVNNIMDIAGRLVGVGDYRPKFGRFEVVK